MNAARNIVASGASVLFTAGLSYRQSLGNPSVFDCIVDETFHFILRTGASNGAVDPAKTAATIVFPK
jgi:hypothetical protein